MPGVHHSGQQKGRTAVLAAGGHLPILWLQALSSGIRKPWQNVVAKSSISCGAPESCRSGASSLHFPSCEKETPSLI